MFRLLVIFIVAVCGCSAQSDPHQSPDSNKQNKQKLYSRRFELAEQGIYENDPEKEVLGCKQMWQGLQEEQTNVDRYQKQAVRYPEQVDLEAWKETLDMVQQYKSGIILLVNEERDVANGKQRTFIGQNPNTDYVMTLILISPGFNY